MYHSGTGGNLFVCGQKRLSKTIGQFHWDYHKTLQKLLEKLPNIDAPNHMEPYGNLYNTIRFLKIWINELERTENSKCYPGPGTWNILDPR